MADLKPLKVNEKGRVMAGRFHDACVVQVLDDDGEEETAEI